MTEAAFYDFFLWSWIGLGAAILVVLFFVTAPYGRHAKRGWGPRMPATLGWVVMEAPASLGFLAYYLVSDRRGEPVSLALLVLWELHYADRAFLFPFRRRSPGQTTPVLIVASAVFFNFCNTYLNGRWLFTLGPERPVSWLADPRFVAGTVLFVVGLVTNRWADNVLFRLRRDAGPGYHVPKGGLYRFISCPNYAGESLQWLGWALATYSLGGLTFAVWTLANLLPRAVSNHRWYKKTFPDYPPERRAFVPFVW
ncbi:MAG: DUF1295 domain-containing protein [Myxococcales bacterium]|nr:DUF1295 domain-containing protein [Myxococcales bacterium]